MARLIKAGSDLYAADKIGRTPIDILKEGSESIAHYENYTQKLTDLYFKATNRRLKKEDSSKKTATGFEFDI